MKKSKVRLEKEYIFKSPLSIKKYPKGFRVRVASLDVTARGYNKDLIEVIVLSEVDVQGHKLIVSPKFLHKVHKDK